MSWLYAAPILLLAGGIIASLIAALEIGHRMGSLAPVDEHQVSTISAPILALVGLILAFSFSMAGDRLALRRAAAVQEANSVGTFWLRTSLLAEPTRSLMRRLVRRYVELHFEHRLARIEESRTREFETEANQIQRQLWTLLMEEARRTPEASSLRLVTPALNAMIDDAATTLAARENRLPDAIFLYLFLLVVVAGVAVGYRPRREKRNLLLWVMFTLVVSGVLIILLDIDRPRRGLIQTDMEPYLRLRDSMRE